jgi:hypothetical protein
MYHIMLTFPSPPNWLLLAWAFARVPILVASIMLPLVATLFLLPRGRILQGWILIGTATLVFAGTGLWIWLHAVFNAEALAGL